jgi:hypothetical protein
MVKVSVYQGILFKLRRPIARGYDEGTQYKGTIHMTRKSRKRTSNSS